MKKIILLFLLFLFFCLSAVPVHAQTASTTDEQPAPMIVRGPEAAAQLTYQTMEDGKLLVSVTDIDEKPLMGLAMDNFAISQGPRAAKILGVEPLETSKEVALNIIMVVDNSASMQQRQAIGPLKDALQAFYKTLRPIDTVSVVVFDDRNTIDVDGQALHAKVLQTNEVDQLSRFINKSMSSGLTEKTYLFDAIGVGLHLAGKMPAESNKFLVVFSDGEDINSTRSSSDIKAAARTIPNLAVYAVDYMPSTQINPFLAAIAANHSGQVWKAGAATDLLPIFEKFSSTLLHRYVVSYRFPEAPKGTIVFADPQLTIEEVTTIDSSPLLNQIYFETGQSELPDRYVQFAKQTETAEFDEKALKGALEKYRQVLNIIGSRLRANPEASIRLVGCNSNTGIERGRTDLSRSRAHSVQAYLRYVWGIAPERMAIEARNLPEVPSTNRIAEGQTENQRVEIYADRADITDTVDSNYVQKVSNLSELRLLPEIQAEAGIENWQVDLFCGDREIRTMKGQGAMPADWTVPLEAALLEELAQCDSVQMQVHATDTQANILASREAVVLPVKYLERTEQMAKVEGYRVKEQYALILFDYDSAELTGSNKAIVNRIVKRINELPEAAVSVTGHTDNIGSEAYNLKLSDRRAQAVKAMILEASADAANRLQVRGVGPNAPLYDNTMPEGRALNRTVTVMLEYMQK